MARKEIPQDIQSVIQQVMGTLAERRPQGPNDVQASIERIFTEQEKKHLKVSSLKDQALTIHVDSPAWLYQLNLKRQAILKTIQEKFPDIQRVYFKIGKVK